MDDTLYRAALLDALNDPKSGLSEGAVKNIVARFDANAKTIGAKKAFETLVDEFSHCDAKTALAEFHAHASTVVYRLPQSETGQLLEREMTVFNQRRITYDPARNIKGIVQRFNENIDKMSITLSSQFTNGRPLEVLEPWKGETKIVHSNQAKRGHVDLPVLGKF